MNEAIAPAQPRRPRLGLSAEVVGVIGAILCVVLIIGIWMGRGWFSQHADAFVADADKALAKATQISDTAIAALETRAAEVDSIATDSGAVATDPSAASGALQSVIDKLSGVAQRYASARDQYLTLKTRVSTTLDTLGRLDSLIPALTVPPGIKDALGKVDDRLASMDAAVTSLGQSATNLVDVRTQASKVASAASAFASQLRMAEDVGKDLQTGLQDLETRLTDAINTVDGWIGIAAIVFTLLFAWVFVLHLALVALGRRWRAA